MRYGIEKNKQYIRRKDLFPVQSSVLDEEALFIEVIKDYCIQEPTSCRFLSRGDSDIYRIKTATRNFYLKVYRPPKSLEAVENEALLVRKLNLSEISVVLPVCRTDGTFATQVFAPEGRRPMLLYEEAPPSIPSILDEKLLSQIGAKIAVVHNITDKFDAPLDIPELEVSKFLQENIFYTRQFLSDEESAYLLNFSERLNLFLKKQPRNPPEFGICHGDLVLSNVRLSKEGEITLFDFGNVLKTWRTFELAVVYWSLRNQNENREKLWDAFLQGYNLNRALPDTLSDTLYAMLSLRQIGFLGGNCATLPLRLGTEPFESGFIEKEMERLKQYADRIE